MTIIEHCVVTVPCVVWMSK